MRYVKAFFRFWYAFIVGDDWCIAAGVTGVLALGSVAVTQGLASPTLTIVLFAGLVLAFVAPILGRRTGLAEAGVVERDD